MAKSQFRSVRKVSGRKYIPMRKKRHCELGRNPALTLVGNKRIKVKRTRGGNMKRQLLSDEFVNVSEGNKTVKMKIVTVVGNPANTNYSRRNIVTKGSIVKTEKGDVKITSRPGQVGALYGVYI